MWVSVCVCVWLVWLYDVSHAAWDSSNTQACFYMYVGMCVLRLPAHIYSTCMSSYEVIILFKNYIEVIKIKTNQESSTMLNTYVFFLPLFSLLLHFSFSSTTSCLLTYFSPSTLLLVYLTFSIFLSRHSFLPLSSFSLFSSPQITLQPAFQMTDGECDFFCFFRCCWVRSLPTSNRQEGSVSQKSDKKQVESSLGRHGEVELQTNHFS